MMKQHKISKRMERGGFTLMELLMVVTIIAMLGSMSIVVSRASIESARASRTEMTIKKIDQIITSMYEQYQYRKIDVTPYLNSSVFTYLDGNGLFNAEGWPWSDTNNGGNPSFKVGATYSMTQLQARWRLHVLRDTIRMDMPCCWAEVFCAPTRPNPANSTCVVDNITNRGRTSLNLLYKRSLDQAYGFDAEGNGQTAIARQFINAELLYLIVTNGDPESRAMFSDKEIGDINGNGLFEFKDGWGNPICWIRWSPWLNTDRQTYICDESTWNTYSPDPLNPFSREKKLEWRLDRSDTCTFAMVPIVFSAGADGDPGINWGWYSEGWFENLSTGNLLWFILNPYSVDDANAFINTAGLPRVDSGVTVDSSHDNIHSHKIIK